MAETTKILSKRNGALDLFRFIAVVLVFFGHFAHTFNYVYQIVPANLRYAYIIRYATPALMVFFMVSAYVVTMTAMNRRVQDFLVIRASRLYPLFWLSCITAYALARHAPHSYLAVLPFKTLLANLTMIPGVFGFELLNPVYHTLIIELSFYAAFILISLLKLWQNILVIILLTLGACIASVCLSNSTLYVLVTPFTGGMLFSFIQQKKYTQWKVYALLAVNCWLSVYSAWGKAAELNASYVDNLRCDPLVLAGIILFLYFLFLMIAQKKLRVPGYPLFQTLGMIAYPFYLFHLYFLGVYWYFRNTIQPDLLIFGLFGLITLLAWVLNRYIEKPCSELMIKILVATTGLFSKKALEKENESVTNQL
jgi:peptidoglycan/LPS O-acetylase OafA/YrhL